MKKETISLSNIQNDLMIIANTQISNDADVRLVFIVPLTLLSVLLGIFLKNIWISLAILALAVYHTVRFVFEYRDYKAKKKSICDVLERGDISISTERFSHVAAQTIVEPHNVGTRIKNTKTAVFFYFESGVGWRVPSMDKHYKWSKEYYVSTKGLENISIQGDEFFYVSLQGHFDIAYIYPCKNFTLDEQLKSKS